MKLEEFIQKLSHRIEILVGYPADKGASYPDGTKVASIAKLQEEGGKGEGGNTIPPRPFMKTALEKNKEEITKAMLRYYRPRNLGRRDYLEKVGVKLVSMVRSSIENGAWKPNADFTVKKKGSNKPLIDTKRMKKSVTYEVNIS